MLQRLGLAQALIHDPDVVFLDEPTDGLDPLGRSHVRAVLTELKRQGKTVFLNSHILQEVELICDRVAILDQGNVRFVGSVQTITDQPTTEFALELIGPEDAIRAAFGAYTVDAFAWKPEICRATLRVPQQFDLDYVVDQLRAAGVSILGVARRRMTLEDAFLKLVGDSAKVL
jgi:ABC-2 type transport system ATP-binding protein